MGATMGDRLCCSEVFTNCAEIQLVGEGGSSPSQSSTTATPTVVASTTVAPSTTASTPAEPEPEPEQTEVPTPAPAPATMTCVATPGLNRGVTDAACAKCADGYKWWPCNEDILCKCSGSALVQVHVPTKRAVGSRLKRHGAFLAPDHAMLQAVCFKQ